MVLATTAERDAAVRHLAAPPPGRLGPYPVLRSAGATFVVSGVGPGPAAAATATGLASTPFAGVLSSGICGAFRGAAGIGDIVVGTEFVAADVGADSPEGFLDLADLGWAELLLPVAPGLVRAAAERLRAVGLTVVTGPVLTVSTATGTQARAAALADRHGAVAEAMEGRAVADAAQPHGIPVLEVRAVSNLIGPRDTASWRIDAAFHALAQAMAALLDGPLPWR